MSYSLFILPGAQKELAKLPKATYLKVKQAIVKLGDNPRGRGCSKLVGRRDGKSESIGIGSFMK